MKTFMTVFCSHIANYFEAIRTFFFEGSYIRNALLTYEMLLNSTLRVL